MLSTKITHYAKISQLACLVDSLIKYVTCNQILINNDLKYASYCLYNYTETKQNYSFTILICSLYKHQGISLHICKSRRVGEGDRC